MNFEPARWLRLEGRGRAIAITTLIGAMLIVLVLISGIIPGHKAARTTGTSTPVPGSIPATATISLNHTIASVSSIPFGINEVAWDSNMVAPGYSAVLKSAGVDIIRFPGGSTADNYHWQTQLVDDPTQGSVDPNTNFDAFMNLVNQSGSRAMIAVNYGSGTPQEAADWVAYANKNNAGLTGAPPGYGGASLIGHAYGIKYWEIGNEVYGDGVYGTAWEHDTHAHDPATYANGLISYSKAMKAIDSTIHVGADLTAPGNWPDGVTNSHSPKPWNDTILSKACSAIDFVDVHWYPQSPGGESDASLLSAPEKGDHNAKSNISTPDIATMVTKIQSLIGKYCGAHAGAVQIMVTATNSVSYNPGKQTTSVVNALFLDDDIMTWLEHGAANVDWWAGHDGPSDGNISSSLSGNYNFGDFGILSRGMSTNGGVTEPPLETPFPSYYGLQMLAHVFSDGANSSGDHLLATSSNSDLVTIHANALNGGQTGRVNVLFINKNPNTAYSETVTLPGGSITGTATVYTYGEDNPSILQSTLAVHGDSLTVPLPPYSLVTVDFSTQK